MPRERITVIASGSPETKLDILNELQIRYFVEDRLETCRHLKEAGIEPLLFDQPWNRNELADGLIRIQNWMQLKELGIALRYKLGVKCFSLGGGHLPEAVRNQLS